MSAPEPVAAAQRRPAWRAAVVSSSLLASAALASAIASEFIAQRFPDRPSPHDLLFEATPYVVGAQYVADGALLAALVVLAYVTVRLTPRRVPGVVSVFALMYLMRAVAMVLTPLASAAGNGRLYGFVPLVQNGMWPSGHTAAALLCVLCLDERLVAVRRVQTALAVLVWTSLLLSHGHYSIDILGGLLLAYFVAMEWKRGTLFDSLKRVTDWTVS